MDTRVVLDKDENLLRSGLRRHRSCHSNEMTLLPNSLAAVFLSMGTVLPKSFTGAFSSNCMSKTLRCLQITAKHKDGPFFTVFLTIKTSSQDISITLLQILLNCFTNIEAAIGKSSHERFWKNSSQGREI